MSQTNRPYPVLIEITDQNFPQAAPALQGYANKITEDARAWVASKNFPPDLHGSIMCAVMSALLRDGIFKLTQGLGQYDDKVAGTHYIEASNGELTAYSPSGASGRPFNPWILASERLPELTIDISDECAGEGITTERHLISGPLLIQYVPPFPVDDSLAHEGEYDIALVHLHSDGDWRDSQTGSAYENIVAWMPVPVDTKTGLRKFGLGQMSASAVVDSCPDLAELSDEGEQLCAQRNATDSDKDTIRVFEGFLCMAGPAPEIRPVGEPSEESSL